MLVTPLPIVLSRCTSHYQALFLLFLISFLLDGIEISVGAVIGACAGPSWTCVGNAEGINVGVAVVGSSLTSESVTGDSVTSD
mmetsp:Transcript_4336/g.6755  ORF Transcript_4336/g.6755 Transcript_4336/m.6755 type:complete len:83 (-) Transcript_4336:170-418(-)